MSLPCSGHPVINTGERKAQNSCLAVHAPTFISYLHCILFMTKSCGRIPMPSYFVFCVCNLQCLLACCFLHPLIFYDDGCVWIFSLSSLFPCVVITYIVPVISFTLHLNSEQDVTRQSIYIPWCSVRVRKWVVVRRHLIVSRAMHILENTPGLKHFKGIVMLLRSLFITQGLQADTDTVTL